MAGEGGIVQRTGNKLLEHGGLIMLFGAATVIGVPAFTPMLSDAGASVGTMIKNGLAL